jgi:hypothetical protein
MWLLKILTAQTSCINAITFFQWFLAICYTLLIFFTALADTATFSKPLGLPMVTTKYNSQLIMGTFPGTLCMALVTAAGDYFVVKWNRRKIQPNNRLFF